MAKTEPSQPETASSLKKSLGLFDIFAIASGAMISSGLFVLPGLAFAQAGPSVVLAYGLAGLLMLPSILSQAELATAMPKTGGSYFFIERSLGPLMGTVAGFANWLSLSLKSAFALVGIGALVMMIYPQFGTWGLKVGALAALAFFSMLNILSIKGTGRLQAVLVAFLLAILVGYVIAGIGQVEGTRYLPFMDKGFGAMFAVAGMVFVSYGGLTKVASVAEEIRNPSRNLPLGMFLAFGLVSTLYVLVVFVTVGLVEGKSLSGSLTPIALGAMGTGVGHIGVVLIKAAALLAFATTANAGILSASRSPMAMSRDGLAPALLAKTSRRFGSPYVSVAVTAGFMAAVILFLSVEDLVKTASTMMLLMFALVNICVIVMRTSGLQNYRPTFRAPLFPWLQIASVIVYAFLIVQMGAMALMLSAFFALVSAVWYIAYVSWRIERESAFVFLVKSLAGREFSRPGLEEELKQITLERDEVAKDRFDKLVEEAVILDIEGQIGARELLHRLSEILADRVGSKAETLYELFIEREKDSNTVVGPGIAIPHIIVDGQGVFDLLMVRCVDGIVFSELHAPVTTAFVLIGSRDERNYHLRALMTIAHIVTEAGFEGRWRSARGIEGLRDVVLLSKRQRQT